MQYDNNMKGSLWLKVAKSTGQKYMGGEVTINNQKYYISVFKNNKKAHEKQPDYNIVLNLPNQQKQSKQYDNSGYRQEKPPVSNKQQVNNDTWNETAQNTNDVFNGQDDSQIPF